MKCQSIQPAFGPWSGSPWTPSRCLEGYSCWQSLGWCWIWFKCTDHSLSMPILAVLKMKLASRMMVNINYRCLCLHLTTFSSWQFLWSSHGLIVSTFIFFFLLKQCIPLLIETLHAYAAEVEILSQWLAPKAAIKPLVPLRLKNLATSHLVLRGKASQMICDHRNFTLGQLEAGCLPANELAPHHKGGTTPRWCCRFQQWLPAA